MIRAKVDGGRYGSTSEVVREALRLMERMEQREAEQTEYLRRSWSEGIASGDAGELDFAELKAAARREFDATKE